MDGLQKQNKKMGKYNNYYVCNDEILDLIKNSKESKNLENIIVSKLSYLIYSRIRCYRKKNFYYDLLQEGKIGLIKAIRNFDSSRGLNFFIFASWHINNNVTSYLRWVKRGSITNRKNNEEISTSQNYIDEIESKNFLLKEIDKLPSVDKKIILMRYGFKKFTFKEIGDVLSLSKQRVQQIEVRALGNLCKNEELKKYFNRGFLNE